MSWQPCDEPDIAKPPASAVETVILPRARDLGEFEVRRALPSAERQMIGPFIFFDQMGPAEFLVGRGMDVRPHPHIGLSTVTYLFRGEILHRDSLGTLQAIRAGELNWMTAGEGITHSERTAPEQRAIGPEMYGIQAWVALPKAAEDATPAFEHYAKSAMPRLEDGGKKVRVIAGSLYGERSPVKVHSPMFYAEVQLEQGACLPVPAEHEERGIYLVEGEIEIAGDRFEAGRLLVLRPGDEISVRGVAPSRLMLLGGEPMDGPRLLWWNFVASSQERIQEAKERWRLGRFDPVPGDDERIPLPERVEAAAGDGS